MFWIVTALADPTYSLEIDFDGNGKKTKVVYEDNQQQVRIGNQTIPCEIGGGCTLEIHDIDGSKPGKDLAICESGMRDWENCTLYHREGKTVVPYGVPSEFYAPSLKTSGNGIVVVTARYHRLYTRVEKYIVKGGALVEVPQALYTDLERRTLAIDTTFPILVEPEGQAVVANVRPKSTIHVLGEHATKDGWILLRLSSGVTGFAHVHTLQEHSKEYMMIMGAG